MPQCDYDPRCIIRTVGARTWHRMHTMARLLAKSIHQNTSVLHQPAPVDVVTTAGMIMDGGKLKAAGVPTVMLCLVDCL